MMKPYTATKKVYAMTLAINRFKISANSFIDGLLLSKDVLAAAEPPPAD